MKSLSILPHIGIGPLRLKMSPEQILNAIYELLEFYSIPNTDGMQISKEKENEDDTVTVRYLGHSFFFMVSYEKIVAVKSRDSFWLFENLECHGYL